MIKYKLVAMWEGVAWATGTGKIEVSRHREQRVQMHGAEKQDRRY